MLDQRGLYKHAQHIFPVLEVYSDQKIPAMHHSRFDFQVHVSKRMTYNYYTVQI